MRKSKNRYFYQIFVSPGDAPGVITLNVIWMEREFDAYKLSRCMNCFWDLRRYAVAVVVAVAVAVGRGKLKNVR